MLIGGLNTEILDLKTLEMYSSLFQITKSVLLLNFLFQWVIIDLCFVTLLILFFLF